MPKPRFILKGIFYNSTIEDNYKAVLNFSDSSINMRLHWTIEFSKITNSKDNYLEIKLVIENGQ